MHLKFNIFILFLWLFFWILAGSGAAEVTLEIRDPSFPGNCGASWNEDIESCNQCHFYQKADVKEDGLRDMEDGATIPHKEITSLEEKERITVSVPDADLLPNQIFSQTFTFSGGRIMYAYGYCKEGDDIRIHETRWIRDSVKKDFTVRHDGKSLPLLNDEGDYIFALKFLHSRDIGYSNRLRWEELVLIWTLSVSER